MIPAPRDGIMPITLLTSTRKSSTGLVQKEIDKEFDPEESLRAILKETGENSSSMKEDLARGRRTEIEEITGAIVRQAGSLGEPVPIQTSLLTLIRAAEHRLQ